MKESFAVSAVCLLLWLLVSARASERLALWFAVGLVAALLALLRENMLLVVPFLLPLDLGKRLGKGWMADSSARDFAASRAVASFAGRGGAECGAGRRFPADDLAGWSQLLDRQQPARRRHLPAARSRQAGSRVRARRGAHSRRAGGRAAARRKRGLELLAASVAFVGARRASRVRPLAVRQARSLLERLRVARRGRLLLDEDDLLALCGSPGSSGAPRRSSRSGGSSSSAGGSRSGRRCSSSSSAGCSRRSSSSSSRAIACRRCRGSCCSPRFLSLAR